jgi:hypothetical protein
MLSAMQEPADLRWIQLSWIERAPGAMAEHHGNPEGQTPQLTQGAPTGFVPVGLDRGGKNHLALPVSLSWRSHCFGRSSAAPEGHIAP